MSGLGVGLGSPTIPNPNPNPNPNPSPNPSPNPNPNPNPKQVGVGSNAQELGQYVISHVPPEMRRARAREWVESYHAELTAALRARGLADAADAYTCDACFDEYVAGGAGRWVWFVPVLIAIGLPAPMIQFFHDQLSAFLHDHVAHPADSPMPRV